MKRNWLEWSILIVSVAVLTALVGYLVVAGLSRQDPAAIVAEVDPRAATSGLDGAWLVPLTVRNAGGSAAVSILVEGTATVDGRDETSEVAIDVLAADSTAELMLGYSGRPDGEVRVRVVGFEIP